MPTCQHPAAQIHSDALLMTCPDCGAECSGAQVGDDALCYDERCPLHVMEGEIGEATTSYAITWSHGQTDTGYATLAEAEAAVRSVLGAEAEIGHDGDIAHGGERTMFWRCEADSLDDDGVRARGSIYQRHSDVVAG